MLWGSGLLVFAAVLMIIPVDVAQLAAAVSTYGLFWAIWRLALAVSVVWWWPALITIFGQRQGLSAQQLKPYLEGRWLIVCVLLGAELLLVQQLPAVLIGAALDF